MDITIGKIVTSNAHTDYVCQIYGPGEIDPLPRAPDYAYGTFVAIDLADAGQTDAVLVGLIYNTLLVNPDYGNLGPRSSTARGYRNLLARLFVRDGDVGRHRRTGLARRRGHGAAGRAAAGGHGQRAGLAVGRRRCAPFSRRRDGQAGVALHALSDAAGQSAPAAVDGEHRRPSGLVVPGTGATIGRRAQQSGVEKRGAAVGVNE